MSYNISLRLSGFTHMSMESIANFNTAFKQAQISLIFKETASATNEYEIRPVPKIVPGNPLFKFENRPGN